MSILDKFESELSFDYVNPSILLLEISKDKLIANTDAGRIIRSKTQVKTTPVSNLLLDDKKRLWMLEYNFKSVPSTEEKRHWGYVVYDMINEDVMEAYCDCKDFGYRLYAPYVKARLARWSLNNKYLRRRPFPHNHKWTVKTNPTGKLYCCKHLASMLDNYVGPEEEPEVKSASTSQKTTLKPEFIPKSKVNTKITKVKSPPTPVVEPEVEPEVKPEVPVKKPLAGIKIDKRFKQKTKPETNKDELII